MVKSVRFEVDEIVREIHDAADEFLRPRFHSLESGDIREKSPGELVTVADDDCEARLGPALQVAVPGSALVGEEAASRDPSLFSLLNGDAPVWLLDPLDGTAAFAAGSPDYAVMAALIVGGETVLSVIHQPEYRRTFVAELGSGAHDFESGTRLSTSAGGHGRQLCGAVMKRFLPPDLRIIIEASESRLSSLEPVKMTAGVEYPAIAEGKHDFMLYWRTLPWDHAPGALLLSEAGGKVAHLDGARYRPDEQREGLLVARTPEIWEQARHELGI